MAVMYCSGEFLFDGCNRVSSLTPTFVPRHPCRPPGASGSLFSSESLIHVTSSSSPPLSPDVTRRPCKDTLTLRVCISCRVCRLKFIVLRTRCRALLREHVCFFALSHFRRTLSYGCSYSLPRILAANYNSTSYIKSNQRQ